MSDASMFELRLVRAELAGLRECIADLQHQLLAKHDRRTGLRLVPSIARLLGEDRPFEVAALAAAALNATSPAGGVVRDVLTEHADADGGFRAFGRLLQRLHGVPMGGWRIQRAGPERWRLVAGFRAE